MTEKQYELGLLAVCNE